MTNLLVGSIVEALKMSTPIEAPLKGRLRLHDFAFVSGPVRVCWRYEPAAGKVLPLLSFHPKVIRRGIEKMCLSHDFETACVYIIEHRSGNHVGRLKRGGVGGVILTVL